MAQQEQRSSDRLRRVLEQPLREAPRSLASRVVQWSVAAIVMSGLFAWITWQCLIPSEDEARPPPDPRLFELLPADYMTPEEGVVRAPTAGAADADDALLRGAVAEASLAYSQAFAADARDRYAAFLAACTAVELDRVAEAVEPLRAAAGATAPLRSPMRSVRLLARMVERRSSRPGEPLADSFLRALAADAADADVPSLDGRDALRDLYATRLLSERAAPVDPTRLPPEELPAFEVVTGEAPLDAARSLVDAAPLPVELFALTRLRELAMEPEHGRIADAIARLAAAEPDNAYWPLLIGGLQSPFALAASAAPGYDAATLATEDEPDVLAGLSPETMEAFEEAASRPRCDPHLRELVALDESLRRAAGDTFAPLHVRPAKELLFLGDPRLAGRITYRALVAERAHGEREVVALLSAAVALDSFTGELAHDPFSIDDPFTHRERARALLLRCDELGLERGPFERRLARFEPLERAATALAPVRGELDLPLPMARLVRELFERYAADRSALVRTLRRYLDE